MTNFHSVVINLPKEKHEFSKWKHISVSKDSFYHSNCNPSQKSENMMFPNPDTLTCVSSFLR